MSTLFFTLFQLSYGQRLEEQLIGKWKMTAVIQAGEDVSTDHNPAGNRYFIFKKDGTFESGGDPYGSNTGRYFVNNLTGTLYIDSSVGPEDDSMWIITLENDRSAWQGFGTEWAEDFVVRHQRIE